MQGATPLMPASTHVDGFQIIGIWNRDIVTTSLEVRGENSEPYLMKIPNEEMQIFGRFMREAEILRELNGPEFPRLIAQGTYSTGMAKDVPYLVTEKPPGKLLARVLEDNRQSGRRDVKGGMELMTSLAKAAVAFHSKGIVHRNLSPSTISILWTGQIQVLDFVLGRGSSDVVLTQGRQQILGNPAYIAPEQLISSHTVDTRADLYSIGIIGYEYCTLVNPWATATTPALLWQKLQAPPTDPRSINPEISAEFAAILLKALALEPADRYHNASDLVAALQPLLAP